jgi:hypothetical protein
MPVLSLFRGPENSRYSDEHKLMQSQLFGEFISQICPSGYRYAGIRFYRKDEINGNVITNPGHPDFSSEAILDDRVVIASDVTSDDVGNPDRLRGNGDAHAIRFYGIEKGVEMTARHRFVKDEEI